MSDFPRKAEALRAFEQWVDSPASDLHPACMTAKTEDGWPEVVLREGDNDFHMGEYVGWMNAWQALSERESHLRVEVERLQGLEMIAQYEREQREREETLQATAIAELKAEIERLRERFSREFLFDGWSGCSNHNCIVTGPKKG